MSERMLQREAFREQPGNLTAPKVAGESRPVFFSRMQKEEAGEIKETQQPGILERAKWWGWAVLGTCKKSLGTVEGVSFATGAGTFLAGGAIKAYIVLSQASEYSVREIASLSDNMMWIGGAFMVLGLIGMAAVRIYNRMTGRKDE